MLVLRVGRLKGRWWWRGGEVEVEVAVEVAVAVAVAVEVAVEVAVAGRLMPLSLG